MRRKIVSPKRWWRAVRRAARPRLHFASSLVARADEARDAGRFRDAAVLYQEALRLVPGRSDVEIQAGHMFKEARDFAAAHAHYQLAERLRPNDADLQHQLGHFYKTIDRLEEAEAHYQRAASLAVGWADPRNELSALRERRKTPVIPDDSAPAEELVARPILPAARSRLDDIQISNLGGRPVKVAGGKLPVLAGVEAVRGVCFSDRVINTAELYVSGVLIHAEPITSVPTEDPAVIKAVFNLWVDLSAFAPGPYRLELVLTDEAGMTRRYIQAVMIAAPPVKDAANLACDSVVFIGQDQASSVEARVRAQPSVVRPVSERLRKTPESILVLRTDQLGDVVVSVPALRRLRTHFPAAKLVGLLTEANADLARALDLFDEIIVVDFPDDMERRQRTMSSASQHALQARLHAYHFDVAIDLATSNMSRPLLKLTGAKLTIGFDDDNCPWVDGGISGSVRDVRDRGEIAPQSGRIVALVDRLATLFDAGAAIVPNTSDAASRLSQFGIGDEQYAVLHLGARVTFSHWNGYPELARRLIERRDMKVLLLGSEAEVRAARVGASNDKVVIIDRRLPFADLDALLSRATLFVGNDSGPKHLAALRGTPTISIHCARISWAEWGQEQTGVVISRRVPCAGCAIFHDGEECAKDFACITDITVDEVLAAIEAALAAP